MSDNICAQLENDISKYQMKKDMQIKYCFCYNSIFLSL